MSTNKRSKQFGVEEVRKLLELLEENRAILSKKTDVISNSSKETAWQRLTTMFNATSFTPRDTNQLKLKWDNLKKAAKKRAALITNNNRATGGGPCTVGEDPILDRVISMTKLNCYGLPNNFDSDAGDVAEALPVENVAEILPANQCIFEVIETDKENTAPTDCLETGIVVGNIGTSKWSAWTPESLKTPVNTKLKNKKKHTDEERQSKIRRNNAIAEYYEYKLRLLKDKNEKEGSD